MATVPVDLGNIKESAKIFQDANIPIITDVQVLENSPIKTITVVFDQSNHLTKKKNSFSALFSFHDTNQNEKLKNISSFPIEHSKVVLEATSPSQMWKAVIKKHTNPSTKKDEEVLEVWSKDEMKLTKSLNLSSYDMHGKVCADAVFSSFAWSCDEKKLLYIAEKKKEKTIEFFEKAPADGENINVGNKFVYEESWGELLDETVNPVICIVDIGNENLTVCSDENMKELSPSQPQWGPEDSIIFAGIQKVPFRLGRIYCENRISHIYILKIKDGKYDDLTNLSQLDKTCDMCPRVSPDLRKIVFLRRKLSGKSDPHRSNEVLGIYNFNEEKLLVQNNFTTTERDSFELYSHSLPNQVWLNNHFVSIPSYHKAKLYMLVINVTSGTITAMVECTNFFGVQKNLLLSSIAKLDDNHSKLQIVEIEDGLVKEKHIKGIGAGGKCSSLAYSSIENELGMVSYYVHPTDCDNKIPLIVFAHGGPHSVFTDDYIATIAAFCCLGFAVLMVNYRGSTSFDSATLNSLPGNVGEQDVTEVQNFVVKFLEGHQDVIDKQNIFYCGGSHGGFLGAHLMGQYPDFYCAAALRNPVIEVASMSIVSDIPDWCYFEAGLPYSQAIIPTPDDYKKMLNKSPIIHLQKIKAPILLCIGDKDKRVPPSQGKAFYRLLKANQKTVKLLLYPEDSHPLANEQGDVFMNTVQWYNAHMRK